MRIKNMDKLIGREKEINWMITLLQTTFQCPIVSAPYDIFGSYYLACPALSFLYIPLQVVV